MMGERAAPFDQEKLRQLLELFQPGIDDPTTEPWDQVQAQLGLDPELARWFEQVQRVDEQLRHAFRDVPVPHGLADQLLERLASTLRCAAAEDRAGSAPAASASVPDGQTDVEQARAASGDEARQCASEAAPAEVAPCRVVSKWWTSRRTWLWVAGSLVAASFLGLLVKFLPDRTPLTEQTLADVARQKVQMWVERGLEPEGGWNPYEPGEPLGVLRWQPQYWATVDLPWDHCARVYAFRAGNSHLYVFQIRRANNLRLPSMPSHPLPSSGPWLIGAWHASGCLYVAVTDDARWLNALAATYRPA